ncbi:MAG: YbaB/EbfC family nucleoid-associated protein [Bacteroidota bacterium]|nr:YbaB/EbfC family nucleoid-associated protein [Bacteroidota bacterium]
MFDKMMDQMQEQTKAIEKKLETMILTEEAEDGLVIVKISGNKRITDIIISPEIADDLDAVSDLTTVTVNRAIEKAEQLHEKEMDAVAQEMMPGFEDLLN